MKRVAMSVALIALSAFAWPSWAQGVRGQILGGEAYQLPGWFKASFLNFREDMEEAKQQGRHVMAFLHLDGCPYCARMLKENFSGGERTDSIRRHFDVIGINIRGALEVVWIDGAKYSERTLAAHLKVYATPTVVFLHPDGGKILQLDGYRDPRAFGHVLEYVRSRQYRQEPLAAYLEKRRDAAVYEFRDHPRFSRITDFKGYRMPLALLFEDRACVECARFHDKVLNHPEVMAEMGKYLFVRLDGQSSAPLVDLAGNATSSREWANSLGLTYRPGVLLFNEGREIIRVDGRLYHFHFREMLRYVSGGYYKRFGSISQYNAMRREELARQGKNIDYSE
jgi:thioredoxin-related protein